MASAAAWSDSTHTARRGPSSACWKPPPSERSERLHRNCLRVSSPVLTRTEVSPGTTRGEPYVPSMGPDHSPGLDRAAQSTSSSAHRSRRVGGDRASRVGGGRAGPERMLREKNRGAEVASEGALQLAPTSIQVDILQSCAGAVREGDPCSEHQGRVGYRRTDRRGGGGLRPEPRINPRWEGKRRHQLLSLASPVLFLASGNRHGTY